MYGVQEQIAKYDVQNSLPEKFNFVADAVHFAGLIYRIHLEQSTMFSDDCKKVDR